jgi:hypothetical protein
MKPVGPFTVWIDYGYEGWRPTDYATLQEAVGADKYGSEWIITRPVEWAAAERQ